MSNFILKFSRDQTLSLAARYRYATDVKPIQALGPRVRECNYLTKADLIVVGEWKSPRNVHNIRKNDDSFVIDASRSAMQTQSERLRIGILTLMHGVDFPVASVILHWCHVDQYPIIDYRALWSLGIEKPPAPYRFDFWYAYAKFCRNLASEMRVDMRTLDKALWQYSKENQPPQRSRRQEN